jgi:hypothetical protein
MTSPNDSSRGTGAVRSSDAAQVLVDQLAASFHEQVGRALNVALDPGPIALAYVDAYLNMARPGVEGGEPREAIVSLIAAGAGAWLGELISREIGATWIGDGIDPRGLRLLLEPNFVHFAPVDLAYEVILAREIEPGDPGVPEGALIDGGFHLRKREQELEADDDLLEHEHEDGDEGSLSDHEWVMRRLAEAPPLPEDLYYSLTGRYETLLQILELLAARHAALGREPTPYHLNDYIAALAWLGPGTRTRERSPNSG